MTLLKLDILLTEDEIKAVAGQVDASVLDVTSFGIVSIYKFDKNSKGQAKITFFNGEHTVIMAGDDVIEALQSLAFAADSLFSERVKLAISKASVRPSAGAAETISPVSLEGLGNITSESIARRKKIDLLLMSKTDAYTTAKAITDLICPISPQLNLSDLEKDIASASCARGSFLEDSRAGGGSGDAALSGSWESSVRARSGPEDSSPETIDCDLTDEPNWIAERARKIETSGLAGMNRHLEARTERNFDLYPDLQPPYHGEIVPLEERERARGLLPNDVAAAAQAGGGVSAAAVPGRSWEKRERERSSSRGSSSSEDLYL